MLPAFFLTLHSEVVEDGGNYATGKQHICRLLAQWFEALAAFAQDLGLVPITHMKAHNDLNSSFRGSDALSLASVVLTSLSGSSGH